LNKKEYQRVMQKLCRAKFDANEVGC